MSNFDYIAKNNTNNNNNKAKNTLKSTALMEGKIRQYTSLFDGTKKDFSDVESVFNDLYHNDYHGTIEDGVELSREAKKQLDSERLASGVKVTSFAYTRIGLNKALVEFQLDQGDDGDNVIAQDLLTIKDMKIIEARRVFSAAGMIKAMWLSNYHSIRRVQSYQHVDKVVFEGHTSPFAGDSNGNDSVVSEHHRPLVSQYPSTAVFVAN